MSLTAGLRSHPQVGMETHLESPLRPWRCPVDQGTRCALGAEPTQDGQREKHPAEKGIEGALLLLVLPRTAPAAVHSSAIAAIKLRSADKGRGSSAWCRARGAAAPSVPLLTPALRSQITARLKSAESGLPRPASAESGVNPSAPARAQSSQQDPSAPAWGQSSEQDP